MTHDKELPFVFYFNFHPTDKEPIQKLNTHTVTYDASASGDYLCDNKDYDHQCEDIKNVNAIFR